jgi:hypothetical protein
VRSIAAALACVTLAVTGCKGGAPVYCATPQHGEICGPSPAAPTSP